MDISTITEQQALQFATDARQEILDGARPMNDFLFDMGKRIQDGKPMSDRQVDALRKFVVREQEFAARKADQAKEDANAESCPEGTNRLRGVVISVKWRDSDFGGNYKMVLKDERGFRVWMTVPGRLQSMVDDAEDLKGATIEVTASVTPSDDDRVFGFGKQPRDAKLVALAGTNYAESNMDADVRRAKVVQPSGGQTAGQQMAQEAADRGDTGPSEPANREAEAAHDAARIAAGTPTAVAQSVLDTLGLHDKVKIMVNGGDGTVVEGEWQHYQPIHNAGLITVVGLGAQQSIPF